MTSTGPEEREKAHTWARVARQGFADSARYLGSLPESEWNGPTGCAKWTVRDLAGHIAGEAVWYPNLVRGVTRGEVPIPNEEYERLKTLSGAELTQRIEEAAMEIEQSIAEASPEELQQLVSLGWMKVPLWRSVFISATEAVLHDRDAKVPREGIVTIPTEWAVAVADPWVDTCSQLAHKDGIDACPGSYLLQVGDGIGPVTVVAQDGQLTTRRGESGTPQMTLHVTADQFLRLTAGRLDLNGEEGRDIQVTGDRDRALCLNRIFAGIANG
ncbi:MAG TPA: maleylpyruvate isomerase N-terminal domain-containing protein [Chloroflexota bacterium]